MNIQDAINKFDDANIKQILHDASKNGVLNKSFVVGMSYTIYVYQDIDRKLYKDIENLLSVLFDVYSY